MKKILRTILAICLVMSFTLTASAARKTFPDVTEGTWYYDYVNYASSRGLMTGYDNGLFGPTNELTRGQFATILYRIAGSPYVDYQVPFSDVRDGVFYTKAIYWAAANNIMTGYSTSDRFGPQDPITREQLVTVIYRYAQRLAKDVSPQADLSGFPDSGRVSSFAQNAMKYAVAVGIISGDKGKLNPQGHSNRAVVAAILQRFITSQRSKQEFVAETAVVLQNIGDAAGSGNDRILASGRQSDGYTETVSICYYPDDEQMTVHYSRLDGDGNGDFCGWTYNLQFAEIMNNTIIAGVLENGTDIYSGYLTKIDEASVTKSGTLAFTVHKNAAGVTNEQLQTKCNELFKKTLTELDTLLQQNGIGTIRDLGFTNY